MKTSNIYTAYPKNKKQKEALIELMESLDIPFEVLKDTKEDLGMVKAIEEGMKTETVSKENILKTLGK